MRKHWGIDEKSIHHSSSDEEQILPEGVDQETLVNMKKNMFSGVKFSMEKKKKERLAERKQRAENVKLMIKGIYNVRAVDRFVTNMYEEEKNRPNSKESYEVEGSQKSDDSFLDQCK